MASDVNPAGSSVPGNSSCRSPTVLVSGCIIAGGAVVSDVSASVRVVHPTGTRLQWPRASCFHFFVDAVVRSLRLWRSGATLNGLMSGSVQIFAGERI